MTGFGFSAGKNHLTVGHVQVVALYDPEGTIRHIHTVTTMRGADPVTQDHAIAEAKQLAGRHHKNGDTLAVALSDDAEHARRPHRIDPKTKSFVPVSKSK